MSSGGQGEGRTHPCAVFYRALHPRLVGYFQRRIGDQGEAEGLAHETWVPFMRRFDHYQATYDDPVGPLFVIARRKLADWYKARNKAPELPGDESLGERLAQIAQDRPDAIGLADLRVDLDRAVARLTPRQREALALRYIEDLPCQAVAALMGVTPGGVRSLIETAKEKLSTGQGLVGYLPHTTTTIRSTRKEVRK